VTTTCRPAEAPCLPVSVHGLLAGGGGRRRRAQTASSNTTSLLAVRDRVPPAGPSTVLVRVFCASPVSVRLPPRASHYRIIDLPACCLAPAVQSAFAPARRSGDVCPMRVRL
jgi:hypothetical protein